MGRQMQNKKNHTGFTYQLTGPTLLFLLVMTVYPVIFTLCYSFTDYNYLKGTHPFSGLANYKALFQNLYSVRQYAIPLSLRCWQPGWR